jgi:glutaredoxin
MMRYRCSFCAWPWPAALSRLKPTAGSTRPGKRHHFRLTTTQHGQNRRQVGESNENADGLPFALRKAKENFPVTLYTSADCTTDCKQAREILNGRGVPFTEKMLQNAEDANELKQLVGDVFIPSLKVGKQSFRGFESGAYNNLLDLAGYPASEDCQLRVQSTANEVSRHPTSNI